MRLLLRSPLLLLAALLSSALIYGCGSSSKNSVSTTEETFYRHSVVFANNSTLYTSGYNGYGQIGNGSLDDTSYFSQVSNATGMSRVHGFAAGANHVIAYSDASVWAWGCNFQGRLGVGSSVSTSGSSAFATRPLAVTLPGPVRGVAAGWKHSLAVVDIESTTPAVRGQVFAWGGNSYGQVGDGTTTDASSPVAVAMTDGTTTTTLANVRKVAAGGSHSLALTGDNRVFGWGSNSYGQLGHSRGGYDIVAVEITSLPGGTTVADIAAAGSYSLALMQDKTVWGWGYNGYGQLGAAAVASTPAKIINRDGSDFTADRISAGLMHVLAIKRDDSGKGRVWSWGFNEKGQLGSGEASLYIAYPTEATVLDSLIAQSVNGVEEIYAFGTHSFARIDGVWYGWGDNGWGQLGQEVPKNTIAYWLTPVQLRGVPTP